MILNINETTYVYVMSNTFIYLKANEKNEKGFFTKALSLMENLIKISIGFSSIPQLRYL